VVSQDKYVDKYFEKNLNNQTKTHLYLDNIKLATINNNGNPNYILSDHLSSSDIIIDSSGSIMESTDYKPFGSIQAEYTVTDPISDYKFSGKEVDEESALQYFGARYNDNQLGRFVSIDPATLSISDEKEFKDKYNRSVESHLSDPQNLNSYSYVANNPLKNTDPDGEIVETVVDVGFVTYDTGNTLYKGGQFVGSLFSGDFQKVSGASNAFLGSFVDLSVDAGATLIPFVPAGLTRVDDAAKLVNKAKDFDALAQQSKMLKGIENSKAINTIKAVFKPSDTIPGGTIGALRNEIMTGNKTKDIFHTEKAKNVISNIRNVFKSENLNKVESSRLNSISNSLQSLIKHIK